MDFVYVCRAGDNEELRYSIRSVVKHFPTAKIWVVGHKPDWYSGNFIPVADTDRKYENIRLCILAACQNKQVSKNFVLMNDDFFIVNEIKDIPILHGGSLIDKVDSYTIINSSNPYTRLLNDTLKYLVRNKQTIIDYDIHVPMPVNKAKMLKAAMIPNVCTRSLYGNTNKIGGEQTRDVKVYSPGSMYSLTFDYKSAAPYFISSEDNSFDRIHRDILSKEYTVPTIYECPQ